jgi:hypothetical protein
MSGGAWFAAPFWAQAESATGVFPSRLTSARNKNTHTEPRRTAPGCSREKLSVEAKNQEVKDVSDFYEAVIGSRGSFWPSDEKMESQDEAVYFYREK